MLYCCIEPERPEKSAACINAIAAGWPEPTKIITGMPPDDADPFVVWGQLWTAAKAIPLAYAARRPFWQIDNGYYLPAAGGGPGYHRVCYRTLWPISLKGGSRERAKAIGPKFAPWRRTGRHIVFAIPGQGFGRSIGLDMPAWTGAALEKIQKATDRPIIVRPKNSNTPLALDLKDAWALVTHSSNVAIDAVLAGIPVFVAPTSPAAPVGNLKWDNLESPEMFNREDWWVSLMSQQFTRPEMANGTAYRYLSMVREQVDGGITGAIPS